DAMLAALQGDPQRGLRLLRPDLLTESAHPRYALPLATLAGALGRTGALTEARRLADDLLAWVETSGQQWIWPEVQRVRGELAADHAQGEQLLAAAIDEARRQGAAAWGLKAAVSLAERRPADAVGLLAPWLTRFTDGFETPELGAARALLAAGPT